MAARRLEEAPHAPSLDTRDSIGSGLGGKSRSDQKYPQPGQCIVMPNEPTEATVAMVSRHEAHSIPVPVGSFLRGVMAVVDPQRGRVVCAIRRPQDTSGRTSKG